MNTELTYSYSASYFKFEIKNSNYSIFFYIMNTKLTYSFSSYKECEIDIIIMIKSDSQLLFCSSSSYIEYEIDVFFF